MPEKPRRSPTPAARSRRKAVGCALASFLAGAYLSHAATGRQEVEWRPPGGGELEAGLNVRVLGAPEDPPLILLHGLVGSNRYWGTTFDELSSDHRLIAPDLLGFGASPKPPRGYGPAAHSGAVVAALDRLGVDQPAVVVGHSLGGLVALHLAVTAPERVRSLVLFGPPLHADPSEARQHLATVGGPMAGMLMEDSAIARRTCIWFHRHPRAGAALVRLLRPDLPRAVARDTVRHTWESYWGTLSEVLLPARGSGWVAETSMPVRLVVGDRDGVTALEHLRHLERLQGNVSFRIVEGAGHHLPLTHPELCLREIRASAAGTAP